MMFFSTGLVRGLIGQVVGMLLGVALTLGVRAAIGWPTAWHQAQEPALTVGAVFGVLGFMATSGMVSDWWQWARGRKTPMRHGAPEGKPSWWRYLSVDYDHKVIGIQYGVTGLLVLGLAGLFAMAFRIELLDPGMQYITPDQFNTLISWHGIVMIAGILLSVGAMANYLVPLMIGASDMAFPRLNAFAFWINVPGVVLVTLALFFGGWNTGWTGYPPLGARVAATGILFFYLGVYTIGLSSILGAINLIVTILRMRAQGMSLFRMPIFVWAVLATAIIQLTGTQLIGLSFLMVVLERVTHLGFFDPNFAPLAQWASHAQAIGSPPGNVILFQHLFWFYSHPAVYIFVLPGLGVISELLPVFSRKPLFGYKWIALSSMAIALVGFLVWGHHMFVAGMEEGLRVLMAYTTLLVAVPTGVKFFSWLGTMWGGKLTFPTPMLFVLGAISIFLLGGLSGPPNATVATDAFLHDTYWIVGHFHATFFGGFVFPFIAAVYYWFPKMTGRMYNETLGKIHFWLMTPAFWAQTLSQMWVGLQGMRRRIADYDPALHIEGGHLVTTVAGFVIFFAMTIFVINLVISLRRGEVAEANPWGSRSPEFQIPSPVPSYNYARPLVVVGDPYDYGRPEPYVTFASAPAAD